MQRNASILGTPCLSICGNPDLEWRLRREVVKTQCREQADYTLWQNEAGFDETLVFTGSFIRECVDTSTNTREQPPLHEALKISSWNPIRIQITRAQDFMLLGKLNNLFSIG